MEATEEKVVEYVESCSNDVAKVATFQGLLEREAMVHMEEGHALKCIFGIFFKI